MDSRPSFERGKNNFSQKQFKNENHEKSLEPGQIPDKPYLKRSYDDRFRNQNQHYRRQRRDSEKSSNSRQSDGRWNKPEERNSIDSIVYNMVKNEIKHAKTAERIDDEEAKNDVKKLKDDFQSISKQLFQITRDFATYKTSADEKIANLQEAHDEMARKVENLEDELGRVYELTKNLDNPEKVLENKIAAVIEERQKEISIFKEIHIPSAADPNWLVNEQSCTELYKTCQGQVARFLADYLPLLYELPEIITPLKRNEKKEEARAVLSHFWKGILSTDLIDKELEKEHANQRYRTSRKIYMALKAADGAIMSSNGTVYECQWDKQLQKFIPKNGDSIPINAECEWHLPRDIQKPSNSEPKNFIIVAKNDDTNQTRIFKIDLLTLKSELLYIKRKYGNN